MRPVRGIWFCYRNTVTEIRTYPILDPLDDLNCVMIKFRRGRGEYGFTLCYLNEFPSLETFIEIIAPAARRKVDDILGRLP